MGPDWLEGLLAWIRTNPGLAGLAIGAICFLEGIALFGIVVPGILILFGVGALVGVGVLELGTTWAWAAAGAVLADSVSFWIGHRYRTSIRDTWPFNRFGEHLSRGEQFFHRHGSKSVIIGRFIGPVRPIMPVVAGMLGMLPRRYLPAAAIACALWAPVYLLPGVVFGASIELARAVAVRLSVLICVVVALVWVLSVGVSRAYRHLAPRTSRMLGFALRWSLDHPRWGRVARNLVDPSKPESGTLALFGLLLVLATWGTVSLLIAIPVAGGPLAMDQATLAFMERLRTPWADPFMAFLSGLGHLAVLLPSITATFGWLVWRRRLFAAGHWIAAVGLGLVLSVVIGYLMAISRAAVVPEAPGEAVPLVHIGLSVVVYGFFAILIARELPRRTRIWPYVVAAVLIGLIALGRLYFAAHWLSDVFVGVLAGLAWITVLGIAYRTRVRRSFWTAPLALFFFGTVAIFAAVHATTGLDRTIQAYTPRVPVALLDRDDWLAGAWRPLADGPGDRVDFQYAGTASSLAAALEARGWQPSRRATWAVVLEMIQPEPDYDSLPLLPRAWRGQREAIVLHRTDERQPHAQTVLRLWAAAVTVNGQPLFVADVNRYEVDRVTWFFRYWRQQPADGTVLAKTLRELAGAGYEVRSDGEAPPRVTMPGQAGSG